MAIRSIFVYLSTLVSVFAEIASQVHHKGTRDYCLLDKFSPQCKDNEIIMIDSAVLGRMKSNPCISMDGPTGCYADVKLILEGFCAGRQSCMVPTTDETLLATKPCGNNFNLYLTISYSCLQVQTNINGCNNRKPAVPSSNNGYIASSLSTAATGGNLQCPWKIKSMDGQQLNVTIQRFSTVSSKDKSANPPVCHSASTIKEGNKIKNVLLCPSDAKNKSIYLSQSDQIEVSFPDGQQDTVYLIHYQATGCSRPAIPKGTHFKRTGDHATVTCNDTKAKVSWELICKENQWQGEEKSCSGAWTFASTMNADEAPPLGMLLIIVTGIALGVLIGGFLLYLAINAFKRYHGLLPGQQIQNPSYEKPFYNPNNKLAGYNDRTIQRSSMIYGTQRRSYPNRQMPPPVPPPHADTAQMRPPSEISECNRQSHIYETPLFNSL